MPRNIIFVEGNIGTGKSTLLRNINNIKGNHLITTYQEPVDKWQEVIDKHTGKNILELFYEDKKRWAFTFQLLVLQTRYDILMNVLKNYNDTTGNDDNHTFVFERSLFTDHEVFVRSLRETGDFSDVEYDIYMGIYKQYIEEVNKLNHVFIYLREEPNVSMHRIFKRSRKGESLIPDSYMKTIHLAHDTWLMGDFARTHKVHVINGDGRESFDIAKEFIQIIEQCKCE